MTRVLHVIPSLERGGAERMLTQLVTCERPAKPEQRVVTLLGAGPFMAEIEAAGVPVETLEARTAMELSAAVPALGRIIRDWRPDVIQSWLYYADLVALAATTVAGRRATRLYWGVRCSELDLGRYSSRLRLAIGLCRRLSGRPDAIVVNSRAGAESHAKLGYRREKLVTIMNGIDTARFRPNAGAGSRVRDMLGIAAERPAVVHLARVDPQKDHATMIEIARRLPEVTFVAAGRGTKALAGPENLLRLGDFDDPPALLNAADVVLSTSAFGEGYPNAVAEAMACGKPVVATDCGDTSLIVGGAGTIIACRDPDAGARAIEGMLALTRADRGALGSSGRARIEADYSLEAAVAQFDRLHTTGRVELS